MHMARVSPVYGPRQVNVWDRKIGIHFARGIKERLRGEVNVYQLKAIDAFDKILCFMLLNIFLSFRDQNLLNTAQYFIWLYHN